ncbi:DUF6461 domain-containing protein [Streptosporangium lutulentum]|uniref:Uncharacterized protein n=1 Tax=Streptosporangium lutulentum TaxID=1461250 RepID=A0ABT9QNJ5_9ACTN|nr:DUF6461 domain-containing protein [Streptosporangium lutulentum]MDP9848302.1 hypothetical protein [Streptosporangium lutulentum]
MSGATAAAYEWLYREFTDGDDSTWLYAGFVQSVSPEEALRRINVTPGTPCESGFGVAAYAARGGTVLIEHGWAGIVFHRVGLLSAGTAAAAVCATLNNDGFAYYVDGQPITTFGLYSYCFREGGDPDLLRADVSDLGMPVNDEEPQFVDNPVSSVLALAERATGVHLSRARYAGPALIGSTDHLDPHR